MLKMNHEQKIAKAENTFKNAQTVFADAIASVDKSDAEFDVIIKDAQGEIAKKQAEIDKLQSSVNSAKAGKEQNARFKAKINKFVELD
ncbi:hypothetical protein ACQKIY_25875 [Bacillus mycoides]|uniref:hypothetical protein n=1 Tax=Bacillus mycoides TaxID=1405 RepID=UPI0033112916|nr:hypothetical protein [Bacillus cereus]